MSERKHATRLFPGVLVLASVAFGGCAMWDRMMGESVELSGANEVPRVQTDASGTAYVNVKDDCTVSGRLEVSNMKPTAAHIHTGGPNENGPVAVGFTRVSDTEFRLPEGAKLSPSQCQAYRAGRTYVNVHSAAHPGGEVRGQITP